MSQTMSKLSKTTENLNQEPNPWAGLSKEEKRANTNNSFSNEGPHEDTPNEDPHNCNLETDIYGKVRLLFKDKKVQLTSHA